MFKNNRDIVREADGLTTVAELLRSREDEVVDYGCRIAAFFAHDGADGAHICRDSPVNK